ncbi:MAG: PfkB family carbohydrate kinase [Geminicoccaceae bacterium]
MWSSSGARARNTASRRRARCSPKANGRPPSPSSSCSTSTTSSPAAACRAACPDDLYARLAEVVKKRGARLVVDTSGPALAAALGAGVHLVQAEPGEFARLLGRDLGDPAELAAAATELVASGSTELLAVTMGHEGALLATPDGIWRLGTPEVEARSAVGAGDASSPA